jgi:hypothetical protein
LEFVVCAGNDVTTLGDYVCEFGMLLFKDGLITGVDIGIEVGGVYVVGVFEDIIVILPIDFGFEVIG